MGWITFREKHMKATLRYKVRLERIEDTRNYSTKGLFVECKEQ